MATIIEKINALFAENGIKTVKAEPIELQAEGKLETGSSIFTPGESFEVGAEVFVKNDDGEAVVLPDGDYVLEDGTKLVVTEGKVAEKMAKEEDDEKMTKEEAQALVEASVQTALETAMSEFKTELASQIEAKDIEIAKLKEEFSALDRVPRGPKKVAKQKEVTTSLADVAKMDSSEDRIMAIHENFSKQK